MTFEELRVKHPTFTYQGFETSLKDGSLVIKFHFIISPDIEFFPEITLPDVTKERIAEVGRDVLNNLVFNVGMVELMSYWKATCSPEIIIKAGYLDGDQKKWWKDLLINGLGEFFYNNKIDFTKDDLIDFKVEVTEESVLFNEELRNRDLILVSGGKDSATTLGLIKSTEREFQCLMLEPTLAAKEIAKVGGCDSQIIIKRTLDPKLLELNKQGYLNGHTPFSALLAFLSVTCQVIYDYRFGVVSEESSSNEGNVGYLGHEINHQYSKSFRFEEMFREYVKKYLSSTAEYLSILRPLKDMQIAALFSKHPQFYFKFRSCNKGQRTNSWCGRCPKCLFTYMALYPFLGEKTKEIFGKDLLQDESLKHLLSGLVGEGKIKPFECVGTFEENKILLDIYKNGKDKTPEIYHSWDNQNNLPEYYANFLRLMVEKIKL